MSYQQKQYEIERTRVMFDMVKIQADFIKHLASLGTASIVIIGSFLDKMFKAPDFKYLIALSLICFLISVVSCVALYFTLLGRITNQLEESSKTDRLRGLILCFAFGGFLIGLLAFVTFFIKNY